MFHGVVRSRKQDDLLFAVSGFFVCLKYLFCISLLDVLKNQLLNICLHRSTQPGPLDHPSISSNQFKNWQIGQLVLLLFSAFLHWIIQFVSIQPANVSLRNTSLSLSLPDIVSRPLSSLMFVCSEWEGGRDITGNMSQGIKKTPRKLWMKRG